MVTSLWKLSFVADIYDKKNRSKIMSRVRSSGNKATEKRLIKIFRENEIKGWRRKWPLPGKPDFVFPKERIVVFVDGCFWHGCPTHGTIPKTNREFWEKKISRNSERDKEVNRQLSDKGWGVVRIWQHELKEPENVLLKLALVMDLP